MEIFLTFDDGPDPSGTPRVLSALRRAGALATFFVVAPRAKRYPALMSEILGAGHRVEFHCTEHVRHTKRARKEVEEDTRTGLRNLKTFGIVPELWRTPWGVTETWTEEVAELFDLEVTQWTADTHDWRGDTASQMLRETKPLLKPGATVLMHDGIGPGARRSDCGETAALIPQLVQHVRSVGCEPVPMKPMKPVKPAGKATLA